MHRIDTTTAQKDKFGAGKNGFTRGNPQTGVPATDLDDDYFDAIQEELTGVVEGGGLTLNKADRGQILKALKLLFAANTDSMGALASLVGAANKLPYFTGSKAAALADLTAFAREILAQSDAAGVLSRLGLEDIKDDITATNARIDYALVSVASMPLNTRTVLVNPFGNNVPVVTMCEVFSPTLSKWSTTPHTYDVSRNLSFGVTSAYAEGEGIVLRSGTGALLTSATNCLSSQQQSGDITTPQPIRVHVWKVTKNA